MFSKPEASPRTRFVGIFVSRDYVYCYTRDMEFLTSTQQFFDPVRLLSFFSSSQALWYLFGFVLFMYVIVSCVLVYHWRKYGMKSRLIPLAETIYFIVSIGLLVLAGLFITLI